MKVVLPQVQLIKPATRAIGIDRLREIEIHARVSHRAEERQTANSWERFIPSVVLDHGDWSVVEHALSTVRFRVDRGITHELVRHRHFSFTQESTRFVNGRKAYPEGLEFIYPIERVQVDGFDDIDPEWKASIEAAENQYFNLLAKGWRPQAARSVLPNALASTIMVTGNWRAWRHLLLMRTTAETHPDFRDVAIPLLRLFQERVPLLFDDIEPLAKQSHNLRLPE